MSKTAARRKPQNITLEDVNIVFRNFSGNEGQFNKAGDRNFGLLIGPEDAEAMAADGWNIKYLKPREEGDEAQAWLKIKVNFSGRPPRVVLITENGQGEKSKTPLDETMVSILDWAPIETVDLIISPYEWNVNGNTGITAYLQSIFVTMAQDDLEKKYANVPDTGQKALTSGNEDYSNPFNGELEDLGEREDQLELERGGF
ncbi:hypothetical protein PP914_gp118 [Arthrobacter phage Qui]|jgi:hypothetical protein|uniref:Putative phage ssDNA-binding domain-containing protein n=1 Tax=Arthrobacter phage Qui TaxID=2603260 RepID=A0A5B8WIK7_9CAUD|nr:hypothetical protein PP914_gp118 [Arthrobacter phage Qui]QED11607.1 hypothetical protein SEA_QUI_118 [Arthrobacter phage Qui]QOC56439.1 hypothetical protein SEA_PAELLA_118 [Arthrobacter phage Paella]